MSAHFDTADLRHDSKEAKRDHDHKAKWALGGRPVQTPKLGQAAGRPVLRPDRMKFVLLLLCTI